MKADSEQYNPILEDELGLGNKTSAEQSQKTKIEREAAKLDMPPPTKSGNSVDGRKKWKNPRIIALMVVSGVALILAGLGGLSWRNQSLQSAFMTDQWRGVTQQAELVSRTVDKASYDNMGDTTKELIAFSNKLDDIVAQARKQPTALVFTNKLSLYQDLLLSLKSYADQAKQDADNLNDVSTNDLDALRATSSNVSEKVKSQKDKLGLESSLPDDFYRISQRLETIITAHDNAELEKQAAVDATKSKEEQAKQNQANAEEAVSRWTEAYRKGDVNEMKRWMTAAYAKEFDFSEVTSSYRATNYPVSYRRVSTELKSDQYEVVEAITFVTKSDYSPDTNYTQTFVFLVSQDQSSLRWLVNSRRYSY